MQRRRPAPRPERRRGPAGARAGGTAALAALARELLADAVLVAGWAGADRRVGADGRLEPECLREAARALEQPPERVAASWRRALLAGLVEIRESGEDSAREASPGWRHHAWPRDDGAVLRGWRALFDAWARLVPQPAVPKDLLAAVAEHSAQVLSVMHLAEDPVPLEVLRRLLIDEEEAAFLYGNSTAHRITGHDELSVALDWMLDGMSAAHAVRREADSATLSPLGNWVVRDRIDEICAVSQSPGGHTELAADGLLRACAGYAPGAARAEYRAWSGARPTDRAVAELLDVACGEDPLLRGMAFEALRVIGTPAEQAVREAAGVPVLRPYALLWLAERSTGGDGEGADALSPAETTWLWVDTAAAVVDHGGEELLVQHVETGMPGGPEQLLVELRRVEHPRLADVLMAAASAHPDPRLARALRRAALTVHDGGA
ncbi:hypothetical protein BIV57_03015 [Mangrovactinospora gilvigrisea]|uniref:Uncharacterized protein n=1 Tax=Mangrovactinospora gilvigrisea TaxID=1428644 RepID=A0A1J7BJX4_9ACTN|nr:hypothetical protein BIV57_03015 [Mangrovactinospora gilvigrisea]